MDSLKKDLQGIGWGVWVDRTSIFRCSDFFRGYRVFNDKKKFINKSIFHLNWEILTNNLVSFKK